MPSDPAAGPYGLMRKFPLCAIAVALCILIGSAASHADFVGSVWVGVEGAATDATIAQAGGLGAPDATFSGASIDFVVEESSITTVSDFLTSGGAICSGGGCGAILNNSYFLITNAPGWLGTAPGDIASITHDDGIQLAIDNTGNIIINEPAPAAADNDTAPFVGAHAFWLSYGECCGGPAVLEANLGQVPVPEPASLALLGSALIGFGVVRRRRKA